MENVTDTVAVVDNTAAPINPAAPIGKGRKGRKGKTSGAPDYANMSTADLLSAWSGFVGNVKSDGVVTLINTVGPDVAAETRGELAVLVSVGLGLRKAYGRGIKVADVRKLLPSVTIPDGFNPTFGLFLQAARLRPDDSAERKVAAEIRSALRAHIRSLRKAS